jgi:uncharacterized protein YndB with AHSA1/START domain
MAVAAVDTGHRKVSRTAEVHAPPGELFDMVADPRRHGELDGSGTVMATVTGPSRLAQGARFSVKMKQFGVPYQITSVVTDFDDGHAVEWRNPLGHRWRWEFTPSPGGSTRVTETFDYSQASPLRARALELFGYPQRNAAGIEETLRKLQARYSVS